jgi:hypothetical protein
MRLVVICVLIGSCTLATPAGAQEYNGKKIISRTLAISYYVRFFNVFFFFLIEISNYVTGRQPSCSRPSSGAKVMLPHFLKPQVTLKPKLVDGRLCVRTCVRGEEPRICTFQFTLEHYSTMGP